jgi:type III restriction enzyme
MKEAKIEGEDLTTANKRAIESSFSTLLRQTNKTVASKSKPKPFYPIYTKARGSETISAGTLRRDTSIFYSSDYKNEIVHEDTKALFDEIKEDRDFRGAFIEKNVYLFKTPVDLIFSTSRPEEDFIRNLCKSENAEVITAWLKSRNQNFYFIEYSLFTLVQDKSREQSPERG